MVLRDLRIQVVSVMLGGVGLVMLVTAAMQANFERAGLGLLFACVGALPVGIRLWSHARRRRAVRQVVPTALPQLPGWNVPSAEEFTVQGKSFLRMVAPLSPMFLIFGVVMTMLGSIPFGGVAFRSPSSSLVLSLQSRARTFPARPRSPPTHA